MKNKKLAVVLLAMLTAFTMLFALACKPVDDSTGDSSFSSQSGSESTNQTPTFDGEVLESIPESALTLSVTNDLDQTAESNWFITYGENALEITVYVEDDVIYTEGGIYANDSIEIAISKVQRYKGYSEGTISVVVDAAGTVAVKNKYTNADVADSGVTADAVLFSLDGETAAGYYLTVSVPYEATEITAENKDAAVAIGLANATDAMSYTFEYQTAYGTEIENVYTYIALTDSNTYAENPYVNYGATWGNAGALKASSVWVLDNDDGTENAYIYNSASSEDNYVYMKETGSATTFYAEAQISVSQLLNNEQYGKFGLTVTSADGSEGFFYYVDAVANASQGVTFNTDSTNLGYNTRREAGNGGWNGNWSVIGNLGGTSNQYIEDNYVTLGIYRQGGVFVLYANGEMIKEVSCTIGAEEVAYVGIAAFNMTLKVKGYSVETDPANLGDYTIEQREVDYLFIGDSYIDTAFWKTYGKTFGELSSANEGIGGTKVEYWADSVASLAARYSANNVIVHIGVNNIDDGNTTGAATLPLVEGLLESLKTAFPNATIHYVGITHNMLFKNKWAEYDVVNEGIATLSENDEQINYIDLPAVITANEQGSTMRWYNGDGLHFGVDGYATFEAVLQSELGLTRAQSENGLGDLGVQGAPDLSYSGGWKFADGVAHNEGGDVESQLFITGAYGANLYAEAKMSIAGWYNGETLGKMGLAIRTSNVTYFWWLDLALGANAGGSYYSNGWTQVVNRADTLNRDWDWGGYFSEFQYMYNDLASFDYNTDKSFTTMAVAKTGTDVYLIANGKVVNALIGVFGADEEVSVSVFNFNADMYAKDGVAITESTALKTKLDSLEIAKTTKTVDGDMSDWTEAQKANSYKIPATDGREITVYATMTEEGIYLFYDAIHNSYRVDSVNWYENTNVEFRFIDGGQRFASANGWTARYNIGAGASRQVNKAVFVNTVENGKQHTKAEIFVSYSCIEGVSAADLKTAIGVAWKTGGEEGSAWASGDYWYGPECDPGIRNIYITRDGMVGGSEMAVDGNIADWEGKNFKQVADEVRASAALLSDGLYVVAEIKLANIAINFAKVSYNQYGGNDIWWQNTNLELFNSASHKAGRAMFFNGEIYHTGYISNAAYTLTEGEVDTLVIELFIARELLSIEADATTCTVDIGGQLWKEDNINPNTWYNYLREPAVTAGANGVVA